MRNRLHVFSFIARRAFWGVPHTQRHRVQRLQWARERRNWNAEWNSNLILVYIVIQGVYECGDIVTYLDIAALYKKCIHLELALSWAGRNRNRTSKATVCLRKQHDGDALDPWHYLKSCPVNYPSHWGQFNFLTIMHPYTAL